MKKTHILETDLKTINGVSVLGNGNIEITTETDLTNYYTKSETYNKAETNSLVDAKQDTLVSGTSIKTINGQSVLGSGDIEITQTDVTGNAGTATKLETARSINGVEFDGSANITITDNTKQDTLISGTNIKTINGESQLGSGNLSLLTSTNPAITGSITEQVYNLTGAEINPANGTIQYKTVSENTTFTETLISGQSVLLRLIGANSYTITFPAITWVGAAVPTLTANCAIVLWKEQSTLYGAFVGSLV